MDRLTNVLRAQAGQLDARMGQPRFGIVTSVNTEKALARVTLQPDGVLTGWLPVMTAWAGNGWGVVCPPSPGEQVCVIPQEGQAEHGIIVGRGFSDRQKPPAAPVGELWIVHKSGSFLKLLNDGTIRIKGDLHVDGEIHDRVGPMNRLRSTYNAHHHSATGGDTSGPFAKDPP